MSSMIKNPRAAPAKPKKPRFNPARAVNDLDWRRKQQAELSASRAASAAGSPPPSSVGTSTTAVTRRQLRCPNKTCSAPNIVDGVCHSCGAVAEEDSQIVAEVTFGETSTGQAVAHGHKVAHGESGPRMDMVNGRRRVAGGGDGSANLETLNRAKQLIQGVVTRYRLGVAILESAASRFKDLQQRGFCRGRTVEKVAGICLYWAVRNRENGNTPIMLIDIADALSQDVFALGRTFKLMLASLYGQDADGNIVHCPFEPLFPEDIIRSLAVRLGFDHNTDKVQQDAVRIVQRMDRDWIVLGRHPSGICGSAIIIAARMNNYRRTPVEVSYLAKTTRATLQLRLDEFARVSSAQMSVADFKDKQFIPESHDPPAFYRQSKEFQEEQKKKRAGRKRKRTTAEPESEEETDSPGITQESSHTVSQDTYSDINADTSRHPAAQTDADGFVIPPLPQRLATATQAISEDDISEAMPTNEEDEVDALASKYGDVPLPGGSSIGGSQGSGLLHGAKSVRKNRQQGSSLREPVYVDEEEKWGEADEAAARETLEAILDSDSDAWKAAARYAGMQMQELMEKLQSTRPVTYKESTLIDAPDVGDDEFADDPEVVNCLLTEEERRVKERLWLNANKDWLREQQEKEYKAKKAPPKRPRKNPRRPRIGEGQASPASSAGEAAVGAAKRLGMPSRRINYESMTKMLSNTGPRGPGSVTGSEITSRQTSRAGSEVGYGSDEEVEDDDDDMDGEEEDGDGDVGEDYDEDGEEFADGGSDNGY